MKYIQGQNRNQMVLFPQTLEIAIDSENMVRAIDSFVNSLDLKQMGFTNMNVSEDGRPAYHPSDLLKLYIYGYMNRTRSSRELEKETHRNIDVMWLIKGLKPDHNTISNFRRDNSDAIREVFKATVRTAKNMDLIGGTIIAGDSVKLRAQNSKKNNYNQEKIDRHVEYIENKLKEHNQALESADNENDKVKIREEINKQNERKEKYQQLEEQLKKNDEKQISTSDPDSRQLIMRQNITEVAYNIQTTNDLKNKLILDYLTTNQNDSHALGTMVQRAALVLDKNDFTVIFDKGYHTATEIKQCHDMQIETLIAIPAIASQAPDYRYNISYFVYNKETDTYMCPQNEILRSNGKWYESKSDRFKQYRTSACKNCKSIDLCTKSKQNGRIIQRGESQANVEHNKQHIEKHRDIYKLRQQIVEHPYGTIKRQWGFDYTIMKRGMKRVSSDIGFIFTAYNLRRLFNILGYQWFVSNCVCFLMVKIPYVRLKATKCELLIFRNKRLQKTGIEKIAA